jgi:hypothetical protein
MARASLNDIRSHLLIARDDPAYAALVRSEHRRMQIEKMANNGADIVSGGGNGLSFSKSQSNPEYAADLYLVLRHLEDGTNPTSKTFARIV